jgi:A/G-specific adenine glycosylase
MRAFPSAALLAWYARHGRTHLPWRQTRDPYRVVVSEFMLQQTQVERVLPLYEAFVERFPAFAALAAADAADVLRAWRGLGYNSRALRLHQLARVVVVDHAGVLPREQDVLRTFPGIGPYTVAAIRAFVFDESDAALDVNVRRVVHRVLFGLEYPRVVTDGVLDACARAAVPDRRGHDWNSAMMDLGATLCTARAPKCLICPVRATCAAAPIDAATLATQMRTHAKRKPPQAAIPFKRTTRFLRGRVIDRLRDLASHETLSVAALQRDLAASVPDDRLPEVGGVVRALVREGLLTGDDHGVALSRS